MLRREDNPIPAGWPGEPVYGIRPGSHERLEFLAEHPEWRITFIQVYGYFEAVRDEPNTIITDYDLLALLDRARKATEQQQP